MRGVIGKFTMEKILTANRTVVRNETQKVLEETIKPYKMGIAIVDVNFRKRVRRLKFRLHSMT